MYHHHTLGISFFSAPKQLFHITCFFKKPTTTFSSDFSLICLPNSSILSHWFFASIQRLKNSPELVLVGIKRVGKEFKQDIYFLTFR
jgi:hypothetical protein